jgi:hypothetical protein
MRAGALVVIDVRGKHTAQTALVADHDVIQTCAANRTYDALDVCVLPRRAWRAGFHRPHRLDLVAEL